MIQTNTHTELADTLANIPTLLRKARHTRHLSVRAAAKQLDMSFATVSRIESGKDHMLSKTVKVLQWLDDNNSEEGDTPNV
jgi:transcriptional regulator with XRE-family HTH domain